MNEAVAQPDLSFFTSLLPLAVIVFIIAVGVILLYAHFRRNLFRQLLRQREMESNHQKELIRTILEAQETERKRIAQDLHDDLGALLSLTRMQLIQLERQKNVANVDRALLDVRHTTELALASMRRLSHELMPPQLESVGIVRTLEDICDHINMTNEIRIHLEAGELPRWPSPVELAVFRVSMELINNTLRHSGAKQAFLLLCHVDHTVHVKYSDDGKGINVPNHAHGLGLRNMEARINALGGLVEMGNGNHGGFEACFKIPLKPSNNE